MKRRPSVQRAFDEVRFGPSRILNVRDGLPSAAQASRQTEGWLRSKQVERAGEVLIITGRGASSPGGLPVIRPEIERLLHSLKRRGVVGEFREHTAGSFVVRLAPLKDLLEAPARHADRAAARPRAHRATLAGLSEDLHSVLGQLACRSIEALGVNDPTEEMLSAEIHRHFTVLVQSNPDGLLDEPTLLAAARRALREYEEDAGS